MSMAVKYGMAKKARKMAEGGEMAACSGPDCAGCSAPGCMAASRGEQSQAGDLDMIDRIMHAQKMSKGGEVEPVADFEPNDFDVMNDMAEPTEADETGANSGDELGNEAKDEDERDVVGRIMRSRSKKDKMPRPA